MFTIQHSLSGHAAHGEWQHTKAMQVAALGLQQPTPPDLAPRANQAGAHVLDAVSTYIRSAQAIVDKTRRN